MLSIQRPLLVGLQRLAEPRIGRRRLFQQIQQERRIDAGQTDHPVALDYPPRLAQRSLHDELIQGRPLQLSRLLEGVLYVLRHPGRNPASFLVRVRHKRLAVACWVVGGLSFGSGVVRVGLGEQV
jgi:hypothetical protein